MRPNRARIAQLLRDREELEADLANARTADEADCCRADLHTVQHSLFLAGYDAHTDDQRDV